MYACLQMLDYNVPGGKLNRGMAVLDVLAALKQPEVRLRIGKSARDSMPCTHIEVGRTCSIGYELFKRKILMLDGSLAGAQCGGGLPGKHAGLVHRMGAF